MKEIRVSYHLSDLPHAVARSVQIERCSLYHTTGGNSIADLRRARGSSDVCVVSSYLQKLFKFKR